MRAGGLRWLVVAVAVVLAVAIAAVVAVPSVARQVAIARLRALTGRPVAIASVDVSLLSGRLSVRGLRILDHDGGVLAESARLDGRFHPLALLRLHVWFDDLTLLDGHVRIVRIGPDRFNISDLLERPSQPRSALDITVGHFVVGGGRVDLEDRTLTPARTWRSDAITLDARNVSTRHRQGTAVGSTTLAGALITVQADDLQLVPVHLHARVNVRDLDLRLAALYLPPGLPMRLERGVVDAGFEIVNDAHDGVLLNADAVVHDVALAEAGGSDHAVSAPELRILVRELRQRPGAIALRYASLGGDVTALDPTTSPPRPLLFKDVTFTASGLEQPMTGPARIAAHADLPGGGDVDVSGTAGVTPRRADLRVRAGAVPLATIARYLPFAARVDGTMTADMRLVATQERTLALRVVGDATLNQVALASDGAELARVARVTVSGFEYAAPTSVRIRDLAFRAPSFTLARDAAGDVNVTALVTRKSPPPTSGGGNAPMVDVQIGRLRLEDGRAAVTDTTVGGRLELSRMAFVAEDVTWPARSNVRVELSAAIAGGNVSARGTVDSAGRRADLGLKAHGVDLATVQPWLPIVGRVRGNADTDVTVRVGLQPFELAVRGTLGASRLAMADRDHPLLTVGRVEATGVDLAWPTRLAVDRLRVDTPWAEIARNAQGQLSLRALFARRPDRAPSAAAGQSGAPGPLPGMQVSVREAVFDNGGANIIDDAVEPAARFELRGSRLRLQNLTWPAHGPAALELMTPMPGSGTLKAHGTLSIEPTRVSLDAELDHVDLAPGRPYLPFDVRLAGEVSGRAKLTGTFGDTIALVIDGDATLDRPRLGDADRRLATAEAVELVGVRYQYPTTLRIRQLAIRKPWLLIERDSKGRLELVTLLTTPKTPAPAPVPAPARSGGTPPPRVRVLVDKLTLNDGFIRFVDRTIDPDYAEEISAIGLSAEGLGTNPGRRGTFVLRGNFASGTPLTVTGQLGGLEGPTFVDVTVDIRDFPVPRLNPYLDRLSAWIAREGSLSATLHYKVAGDDLDALNDVAVSGLQLEEGGRGAEFSRRIGLPLGTLVSLLKDRHGDIKLNIPVSGRLSSPDFDYSEAVWAALRNLTVRLVTLPFSLVGKVFFSEDSRIQTVQVDPVTFQTASATPTAAGAQQLAKLAAFLKESPAIRLRLRPVTTVADVTALRRQALEARLATLGTDEAARRQAAVGLYTELFPRRQPPSTDEALYEELTRETPTPPRALRTLATERVDATRNALVQAGIAPDRLEPQESRTAVESEGDARVEFELVR